MPAIAWVHLTVIFSCLQNPVSVISAVTVFFFFFSFLKLHELNITIVCWVTSVMLDFCNPMDCSLPGFYVHEILQARIL